MHGRQVTSVLCLSGVIMAYRISAYSGTSGNLFKIWYLMVSKEKNPSCENGIEKSVPSDHCLSSLGKPRDAER